MFNITTIMTMKNFFLTIAFLSMSIVGMAQSASDIVTELKNEQGVESQVLNKLMLRMQFSQAPDEKTKTLGQKMDGMTVMSLSKASDEVKQKFEERVGKLSENGYLQEEVVEEMGVKARTFIKKDGELITEIVNVVEGQGETALIIIMGKFTKDDLEALAQGM